jgi:hypothetical protein
MPCNASYARFIFGKFFTSTIILYVLLFAQKVLFLQKVGVTDPWWAPWNQGRRDRQPLGAGLTPFTRFGWPSCWLL